MNNAILFKKYIKADEIPPLPAIMVDYFGYHNIFDKEKVEIIFGVYQGLVNFKGVQWKLLHACFIKNKLDELIHAKYKYRQSGYYKDFVNKRLVIGETCLQEQVEQPCVILDDDHCPTCLQKGFVTNNNFINLDEAPPDCAICCKMVCKLCASFNEDEGYICNQCDTTSLKRNIEQKLANYKRMDIDRFEMAGDVAFDDIVALLKKQTFRCYICNDMVLATSWKPYCCYQFSVDRVNDTLPHNKNNVLISCYYCNCRHHPEFTQHHKKCHAGCHTVKRDLPTKSQIDIDKINSLLLN